MNINLQKENFQNGRFIIFTQPDMESNNATSALYFKVNFTEGSLRDFHFPEIMVHGKVTSFPVPPALSRDILEKLIHNSSAKI